MKIQTVADHFAPLTPMLRCPLCGGGMSLTDGRSLLCEHGHCFDLSAKGYVNLAPMHDQSAEKYDDALFAGRRRVFEDGFYEPIAQAVTEAVSSASSVSPLVADIGCGEGYYSRQLAANGARVVGLDISRDAVQAAVKADFTPWWMIADLTRLPFADATFDALVDVLTPADYREFARVLKSDGVLVKVVPADDYLCEIRSAVREQLRDASFSNARVIEHLERHATIVSRATVRRTLPVDAEQSAAFLRMTPMTFGLSDEQLAGIRLERITVAMEILICHLKEENQ